MTATTDPSRRRISGELSEGCIPGGIGTGTPFQVLSDHYYSRAPTCQHCEMPLPTGRCPCQGPMPPPPVPKSMEEKLAEAQVPEQFWDLQWDDYSCSEELRAKLTHYLDIAEHAKHIGMGFNLGGSSMGAGKTAAAVLLAKGLLERDIKVRYITFSDLLAFRQRKLEADRKLRDWDEDYEVAEWRDWDKAGWCVDPSDALRARLEQRDSAKLRCEELERYGQGLEAGGAVIIVDGIHAPMSEQQGKLIDLAFVQLVKHKRVPWLQPTITVSNLTDEDLWRYYRPLAVHLSPYQFSASPSREEASKTAIRLGALRAPAAARS